MAANACESLDITLVFGVKKLPIHLDATNIEYPAECLTIDHLAEAVKRETNVDPACQKLIYKGKTLPKPSGDEGNTNSVSLSSLGIRNGDRVMLLARKPSAKKESGEQKTTVEDQRVAEVSRLEELQAQVEKMSMRYEEHVKEISRTKELKGLKTCKKSFMILNEDSMKLLESIDAMPTQNNEEFRKQRKAMVNTLQCKMDLCEKRIEELSEKIRSLESQAQGSS